MDRQTRSRNQSRRASTVTELNPSQYYSSTVRVDKLRQPKEKPLDPNVETILRTEDVADGLIVHEMHQPANGPSYVYMYAAWFTPDGRHLLVLSSVPDIRIYDTSTWEQVDKLPGVPSDAVAYYPSRDWKHGVAVFNGRDRFDRGRFRTSPCPTRRGTLLEKRCLFSRWFEDRPGHRTYRCKTAL